MALMTEAEKWSKRPLSKHQLATMRFIGANNVLVEHLGQAQQNTLGSLLQRHYIGRSGNKVQLTTSGVQALQDYEQMNWRMRENEGPLTDRVANLLKYARIHMARNGNT